MEKEEKEELFASGHHACGGCGPAIAMRHVMHAAGRNSIVTIGTGCMEVVSTLWPLTSWKVPCIHSAFENTAATASGIESALKFLEKNGRIKKKPNVIAIAGDGGTFDIGLQALSGAIERGHKFLFVCYDNGAYMNCLSLDSLVMTEKGLKKITEIQKGEKIYAFNQKTGNLVFKKCTGIFDNGIKKVFELSTLHHTIKATSNHPFLILKRNGRGRQSFFVCNYLGKLKKNDEIVILKKLKPGKSFSFKPIKISKKGDYKVNKINSIKIPTISSPDLMEFLGLYLGDGWVRPRKAEIGFALPRGTKESKRLISLFKKLFKKDLVQKDRNYLSIYSINLANFIDSLGFGKGARNKIVPDWVFTLPDSEKEAFLQGLMLSDGYTIGNSNRYVSASQNLLRTLRLLLQTMGYQVGKIHQQTKKKGTYVVYRKLLEDSTYGYICFSKKKRANMSKYLSQIKQRDFLVDNEYFSTEKIASIKFIKEEPTLDLRVEGEHNFVADGIIVHNTGVQRSSATPLYAKTTTTPAGKKEDIKNMPFIVASHGNVYVATANIAHFTDLHNKLKKALSFPGPSYVQIFTPCVPGWNIPSNETVSIARLAVETHASVLYEIENGIVKLNFPVENPKPLETWLQKQGRFRHLSAGQTKELKDTADKYYSHIKKLSDSGIRVF